MYTKVMLRSVETNSELFLLREEKGGKSKYKVCHKLNNEIVVDLISSCYSSAKSYFEYKKETANVC